MYISVCVSVCMQRLRNCCSRLGSCQTNVLINSIEFHNQFKSSALFATNTHFKVTSFHFYNKANRQTYTHTVHIHYRRMYTHTHKHT